MLLTDWSAQNLDSGLDCGVCGLDFGLIFGLKCSCASFALARCRTYGVSYPSLPTQCSLLSQSMHEYKGTVITSTNIFFAYSMI